EVGLLIRGGWGNSFRAPNFGEFSPISNVAWNGWALQNTPNVNFPNNAVIQITCDSSGNAPAGSGAAKLKAAGFGCGGPATVIDPAGISLNGGGKAAVDAHMRDFFNTEQQ